MPCDKDYGYVTLTRRLTWEHYGDLWELTYITISDTTPEDHLILREFLVGYELMPCDKDYGYVTLTQRLTWERYGDL